MIIWKWMDGWLVPVVPEYNAIYDNLLQEHDSHFQAQ